MISGQNHVYTIKLALVNKSVFAMVATPYYAALYNVPAQILAAYTNHVESTILLCQLLFPGAKNY